MTRKSHLIRIAALTGLALAVTGCESTKETFGLNKQSPDEFQVVSRAPLSMPPEFNLRAPDPGAPRPQTGTMTDQARSLLTGESPTPVAHDLTDKDRSSGEVALLEKSGAQYADPNIRSEVDRETSILIKENESVIDRLVFWQEKPAFGSEVDPAKEAKRIRDQQALGNPVTEGETPTIERRKKGILEDIF
ncbi:hypothetical protein TH25_15845 [Thalassospira profundimaris]|uniref:Beta-barrel assembly machine subunit BamF n=1 Tax=Thalassospira profundimaris TaxID=502049 RepID=A0A367WZY6_9PROT|nr:DUF3035 domain-containing protein [Thalassospira profundimaris]RCK46995.1 hypothetical protein TH25_15845 [Thalassospira profundimaris]